MDMTNAIDVLSSIPYFREVEPSILKSMAGAAILRKYEAGQILFLDSEPCIGLYIVQDGWLKGFKQASSGREQIIRCIGPGEVLNEVGVLAEGKNLVIVQALVPSTVWIIPREMLLKLLDAHPQLCRLMAHNLAQRVYHLINLVEYLSLHTVEGRLAHLLLEQSDKGVLSRQQWATQAEIAAQLGTVPGVISRSLHSLADEGLIRIQRNQIHIVDRQGLEAKASHGD